MDQTTTNSQNASSASTTKRKIIFFQGFLRKAYERNSNQKWFIAVMVILSVSFYTYSVEYLTDRGFKTSQILIWRGISALVFGIGISLFKRYSLLPKSWKPQVARLFLNGLSSYFLVISFSYLSASTVALINRIDIPFLIFLSVFTGHKKSSLQFWLSFWTVAIVAFLALDAKFIDEEPVGFIFAFIAVCLTSVGYFLVRHSAKSENLFLISNVFSLSNVIIGFIILFLNHDSLQIDFSYSWVFIISTFSQFGIYVLAIKLYKWYDIEKARLPFVIAAFFVMILEMIIERKIFSISQIGLSILITGMLITIILNPSSPDRKILNLTGNDRGKDDTTKNGR